MKIISIANQKGGVGKTTTAINLSYCLSLAGAKTLLVDIDPQANATSGLGCEIAGSSKLNQLLLEDVSLDEFIIPTKFSNLFIMPSNPVLSTVEHHLINQRNREFRLKRAVEITRAKFDFCIIDCPPALGLLTQNALCASQSVIIPIQCEYFAMEGLSKIIKAVRLVKQRFNPDLDVEGILLTMYDATVDLSNEIAHEIRSHFTGAVYDFTIPKDIAFSEANSYGLPIFEYNISSPGVYGYVELAKEVSNARKEIR